MDPVEQFLYGPAPPALLLKGRFATVPVVNPQLACTRHVLGSRIAGTAVPTGMMNTPVPFDSLTAVGPAATGLKIGVLAVVEITTSDSGAESLNRGDLVDEPFNATFAIDETTDMDDKEVSNADEDALVATGEGFESSECDAKDIPVAAGEEFESSERDAKDILVAASAGLESTERDAKDTIVADAADGGFERSERDVPNVIEDPFTQGDKQRVHTIGGNWGIGCSPEMSEIAHSWKNAPPPWLHRYGHSSTVAALMPHDDRKKRPVSLS